MTAAEFTITCPTYRVESMRERLAEINKRAIKLRVPELTLEVSNVRIVTAEKNVPGKGWIHVPIAEICEVTVTGCAPVLDGGWSLLGTIDHNGRTDGSANLLLGQVPEFFRKRKPYCDHCQVTRNRTETFVLENAEGQRFQIARTCIKNYLPIDVERIIGWARLASEASELESWGRGAIEPDKVIEFLAASACSIRLDSYKSIKFCAEHDWATPTSIAASMILHPTREQIRDGWKSPVTDADRERAQAALDWLAGLPEQDRSEGYLANLYAASLGSLYVPGRHSNLVASLVGAAYPNALNEARKRFERDSLPESKPVGIVGERMRGIAVTIVRDPKTFESDFGITTLVSMRSAEGCDLIWWASGEKTLSYKLGTEHTIDFTPKAHKVSEYTKRMETQVSRVTISKPPKPVKVKAPRTKRIAKSKPAEVAVDFHAGDSVARPSESF